MSTLTAEVIEEPQSVALAVPESGGEVAKREPPAAMTPQQAKVEAIAALTMSAYQKASQLELTESEIAQLQADFPDEAFQPGAAGKQDLIYIQHAYLRDRLNQVFRPGKWSIIPRNRWAEEFETQKKVKAARVYVEAMLVIRSCFVAEAVGEMEYYPNNASQNYGDAVEGAKTAALRRCCKELGIGLQAWKREFCDGWWQRRGRGRKGPEPVRERITPENTQQPTNQAGVGDDDLPFDAATPGKPAQAAPATAPKPTATEAQRAKMLKELKAEEGGENVEIVSEYFSAIGWLLRPGETLKDLELRYVPVTAKQMRDLGAAIGAFSNGEQAKAPYSPNDGAAKAPPASQGELKAKAPDGPSESGPIQTVTLKEGKSAKGPWSLWGIKVNDQWMNTFNNNWGRAAQKAKGKSATVYYEEDGKGRKVTGLFIEGLQVAE